MFKIISNVGGWQPLFTADSARERLKHFELPNDWHDGEVESFFVQTLTKAADPERSSRSQFIVLVAERKELVESIARELKQSLPAELQAIVRADKLSLVGQEHHKLVVASRKIEQNLTVEEKSADKTKPAASSAEVPPEDGSKKSGTMLSLGLVLLVLVSLANTAQTFLLTKKLEKNVFEITNSLQQISIKVEGLLTNVPNAVPPGRTQGFVDAQQEPPNVGGANERAAENTGEVRTNTPPPRRGFFSK